MGQQQLLLLVLGIVIVGLAVVVGIQAFGENQKKANSDAIVNDAIRIASDAQAWKLKPAAFGGGAAVDGWDGFSLEQVGYAVEDGTYSNLNGEFVIAASATSLVITGTNDASGNQVVVTVTGTSPDDIETVVSNL
jgi:hypothetical protein